MSNITVTEYIFNLGFNLGAICFALHIITSNLFLILIKDQPEFVHAVFVGRSPAPSLIVLPLMRAKYFIPWKTPPVDMSNQYGDVRLTFFIARVTGGGFFLSMIAIFVFIFFAMSAPMNGVTEQCEPNLSKIESTIPSQTIYLCCTNKSNIA